ncbi:hypothetical protein AK830_g1615 [Neonectria ditissima]|uniref:DUF1446 domain-containing protein n=1 Tax=Neonectria ditissima TaxID=78410 RepID=A0A0P7BME8_9HYPO|nr:hypothetical protein AK830_g1615 [Neonectria ditissima]
MISKPALRIGNVSGATGDSPNAMERIVKHGNVDVITGDWLSEMNIAWNSIIKEKDPDLGYERGFLDQLETCLDDIVAKGIKVVTNAGALNTQSLTREVRKLCASKGHDGVLVASVLGDDVSCLIGKLGKGVDFPHLDHVEKGLKDWELTPTCGAAYIGCRGIVEALDSGAQIVICGRCTDASPVMGAAAWYFQWAEDQYDAMAGALLAGHLIECGPYVCGANFSGFKQMLDELVDLSFPVAEIDSQGRCVVTTTAAGGGRVTEDTVRAQILYELQGHLYLNPDVVADLSGIRVEAEPGVRDRVRVSGVVGLPPPATTKVMFAAPGGYQAEASFYINGLDIEAKEKMMRQQLDHIFKDHNFSKLSVELYGTKHDNPTSQQAGTLFLRIFAQARRLEDISALKFKIPIYALRMQSYPGYHMNLDFRTMDPKQFMEIFPATISQAAIDHRVELPSGKLVRIKPPVETAQYPVERPSYETAHPTDLTSFGPTRWVPLGSVFHARSGDKADNSNVGFFARSESDDEHEWLKSFLTVERLKMLLGDDWHKGDTSRRVERVEFPGLKAVHFRILDNLSGGIASSERIDGLGKGIGEYLRSRFVDMPLRFLERGTI